jgi:hypothetical protein
MPGAASEHLNLILSLLDFESSPLILAQTSAPALQGNFLPFTDIFAGGFPGFVGFLLQEAFPHA